jgi:hypothetical protein
MARRITTYRVADGVRSRLPTGAGAALSAPATLSIRRTLSGYSITDYNDHIIISTFNRAFQLLKRV